MSAASQPPAEDEDVATSVEEGGSEPAEGGEKTDAEGRGGPNARTRRKPELTLWQRAVPRWLAVGVVMSALLVLYTQHPYYRRSEQFAPFRAVYPIAYVVWLSLGVFYVRATLERFSELRYIVRDSGLHLIILGRAFVRKQFWRRAKNRRIKTTILGICVKGFFTPLMIGFFRSHLNSISKLWLQHKHLPPMEFKVPDGTGPLRAIDLWWHNVGTRLADFLPSAADLGGLFAPWAWSRADYGWGLSFAYDIIFAIDCGWALFGYSTESRWLGNKTRSVEPTAFGWVVCIFCYPPCNEILGKILPLENGPALNFGIAALGVEHETMLLAFRTCVVLLFAIYASATVAFGFKFSNLTNRGIISRGPYRFVRHPAYLTKCCAWWFEHLPTMTWMKVPFLCGLCGVYALRAWTEERHLSKDPDYLAYKKKTPWVLIPYVY